MRIAAALLTMVVVTFGQDCQECPSAPAKAAKKATPTLSARIAKLEARASKGCKTSASKLAALCKAAGATDTKDLKARVAAYEEYAPCGCDVSKKKLADLAALLAPDAEPLVSGRVSLLLATAAQGDAKSKDLLKKLCDECCPPGCCDSPREGCGQDCGKDFGEKLNAAIKALEASAAEGSRESIAKLAKLESVLATLPTTSSRVATLVASVQKGDVKSKAVLMSLCEECCPSGCAGDCVKGDCAKGGCTKGTCGKDCGAELIGRIKTLESSAARGCEKSAAKLVRIDAKLSGATTSRPAENKKGCGDCGGCPGQQ